MQPQTCCSLPCRDSIASAAAANVEATGAAVATAAGAAGANAGAAVATAAGAAVATAAAGHNTYLMLPSTMVLGLLEAACK